MANDFYDSKQGYLQYSYEMFHFSNKTVPIWVSLYSFFQKIERHFLTKLFFKIANEKAGKHSGCMMWTGSDFDYDGRTCTFTKSFNETVVWEERVDIALSWFTDKKTPANLVMMYIEEPDAYGHIYGPESPVVIYCHLNIHIYLYF